MTKETKDLSEALKESVQNHQSDFENFEVDLVRDLNTLIEEYEPEYLGPTDSEGNHVDSETKVGPLLPDGGSYIVKGFDDA